MNNTRNHTADLLKGFAVLLMVQVHIFELFANQEIYDSSIGSVLLFLGGPPAAPVFMIVMGYFIAKGNHNYKETLIRGTGLIGLGFLLNIGLNFHLFIKIFVGSIDISPLPYLFGVDILFLAGLSIIILGVIRPLFKNNPLFYFILILIIFLLGDYLPDTSEGTFDIYLSSFFYGNSWWAYFPIIPWLAYPLTGVLFFIIEPRLIRITINKVYYYSTIVISGILLILTINYGIGIAANLDEYYHHSYLYLLFIWNFMIFWTGIMKVISGLPENRISQTIQWIGKNVTVFYVIQWLIIGNIATGIYKTQSLWACIIWFIGILLLTSILTFLWNTIGSNPNEQKKTIIIR